MHFMFIFNFSLIPLRCQNISLPCVRVSLSGVREGAGVEDAKRAQQNDKAVECDTEKKNL